MTANQNHVIQIILAVAGVILFSYAGGRAHQWCRQDIECGIAFRDGYNQASRALFSIAARQMPTGVAHGEAQQQVAGDGRAARNGDVGMTRTRILEVQSDGYQRFSAPQSGNRFSRSTN